MVVVTLLVSKLVHPQKITEEKMIAYECGEDPVGGAWIRFNNRFYIIALIFIIFDIEVVFMYPWAVALDQLQLFGLLEMIAFIAILGVAYVYIWGRGGLEWD
ncbi:MAG: NADH-quinone oxidoreductase subunit A [Nitrospinae bacterium]|nr:NADH-quinone oxidoreductase subunit A [Nitrospinota bacterium]